MSLKIKCTDFSVEAKDIIELNKLDGFNELNDKNYDDNP